MSAPVVVFLATLGSVSVVVLPGSRGSFGGTRRRASAREKQSNKSGQNCTNCKRAEWCWPCTGCACWLKWCHFHFASVGQMKGCAHSSGQPAGRPADNSIRPLPSAINHGPARRAHLFRLPLAFCSPRRGGRQVARPHSERPLRGEEEKKRTMGT